jgi:YidC/Oxa1 family membrane protein insertase
VEQLRIALFVALGAICVLIWQAWRADQPVPTPPVPTSEVPVAAESATPSANAPGPLPPAPSAPDAAGASDAGVLEVETDLLQATLSAAGADFETFSLREYAVAVDHPARPYPLLAHVPERTFYVQSGLLGPGLPDHRARYRPAAQRHVLLPGHDTLEVPFIWVGADGTRVRKTYTFHRNSYVVDLRYEVHAGGGAPVRAEPYAELVRAPGPGATRSLLNPVSFQGGAIYTAAEKFDKFGYDDMAKKPLSRVVRDGWVALSEHYFVAALVPPEGTERRCHTRALADERYAIGCVADALGVPAGGTGAYTMSFYLGPKEQQRLGEVAPGLDLTVDYGLLTVIAKPLFWLLRHIEALVGNWGIAIILLTALIKLAFYRLSATSYRSMAQLRRVQPRLLELRERYKDDRAKLNEKMMELYRTEKVNPLGGCLPIVVQIPVFIALYWVLLESVELRHAPFVLWIDDLSSKDPYYVLPVLMGLSMLLQQRMTPMPMEPLQQRVMMVLPLVFTVFFALFPAGLVLYWLVNNVLSILQQWLITRQIERAAPA